MACHPPLPDMWSRCLWALLLSSSLLLGVLPGSSEAQITLDGSLGPRGPLQGPNYCIGAELGQIRGSNLFHSFDQFNVPTRGSATFAGPNTIANIVSRVTGGQPSAIDGVLRSEIAGANLYLLNPSGVLFGPNASLDVSGSFHVSTADYLRFADGAKFFASLAQESVLTVASPAAFGFLGTNPAAMTLEGTRLRVNEGEALSVVGGDLTLAGGHLEAPSGRIQLASVAAPGEVGFSPLELAPDLQGDGFARLGRIALSQGASVKVGAEGSRHAGTIAVVGGQLTLSRGSRLSATTNSGGEGGRIVVTASTVRLMEDGRLEVDTTGQGNGGTIALRVGTLTLTGGARISSRTSGSGQAGTVTVAATEAITMTDSDLNVESRDTPSSRGAAGRIVVTAPTARLMGSEITARARSMSGNGGTIELQVGTLTVTDGSDISTSTNGTGQAGPLTITAHEAIAIAGRDRNGGESILSIRTRSQRSSGGEGGRLVIVTPRLSIGDGGLIRGGTLGEGNGGTIALRVGTLTLTNGGTITTSTSASGQGGLLTVAAREAIVIAGHRRNATPSELVSTTQGPGPGGNLQIMAQRIELRDGGTIAASSSGTGLAGTLLLQAGETFRSERGAVTVEAAQAGGGAIALRAGRLVQLTDSQLTTSVRGGGGDAGNLTFDAPLVVAEGSQIIANAFGGRGGNIQISSDVFLRDPASPVSASSELGIQGIVDIRAPVTTLSGTLAPLPQAVVSAAALLPARCAARLSGGTYSSLVLGGREGLPAEPGGLLPSPLTLDERLVGDPGVTAGLHQQPSTTKFAFLTGADKAFPRLQGDQWAGRCPKAM